MGSPPGRAAEAGPVTVSQFQMGMMTHLTVWTDAPDAAREACRLAYLEMLRLNRILSDYEPASELNALCARAGQGPVPVSAELFEVLFAARRVAECSEGRFDPTAAPLIRLWRAARKAGRPPSDEDLQAASARVGWRDLQLDAEARTAELRRPGMSLDLGGVAKGFVVDRMVAFLRERGFPRCRVEAGGETAFGDPPEGRKGWPVELPFAGMEALELANCAVSISGDESQHLEFGGVRYSHVVDATTGRAVTNRVACVVVSRDGLGSDPLSTLGTLLPEDRWRVCLERLSPGAQGWRFSSQEPKKITKDGAGLSGKD